MPVVTCGPGKTGQKLIRAFAKEEGLGQVLRSQHC